MKKLYKNSLFMVVFFSYTAYNPVFDSLKDKEEDNSP